MDKKNPILEEAKDQMDIVPYTKRDKVVVYLIFLFVVLNFTLLLISVPWGSFL